MVFTLMAGDMLIFIDANQYLDLYRVTKGKRLLSLLIEQQDYIFITMQIVEEIQRKKLQVAADFLAKQFEQIKVRGFDIPDHLFDISGETATKLRKELNDIHQKIKDVNDELVNASIETLQRISQSKDEVSMALDVLFRKAVIHEAEELQRARERKERGNPPGKKTDPLGDQLTWEQLLSHCKDKLRFWIISRDSDYFTKHLGGRFLNPFLYNDLVRLHKQPPEVFCFDSIVDGLADFVQRTRVKSEKLPTPEESQEIKKEQEALPPLDWLVQDVANDVVIQIAKMRQRYSAAIIASTANQGWNPGME
jgi:hypothetical protein